MILRARVKNRFSVEMDPVGLSGLLNGVFCLMPANFGVGLGKVSIAIPGVMHFAFGR